MSDAPLAGIFVGGQSTRMGGRPKGLLVGPHGAPLVRHLADVARSCCGGCVLVGRADAYREVVPELETIADAADVTGPVSGLLALLRRAGSRSSLALACDLAYLEAPLLARLASAQLEGDVLAPRVDGLWQPFFAQYSPSALTKIERAAADGVASFQKLFARLEVAQFTPSEVELMQLRDWDSPADVR